MAEILRDAGYRAAVARYGKPAFRTDAPWNEIVSASISWRGASNG
jgi:tRNA G26 N,N-dimethylase Trm1